MQRLQKFLIYFTILTSGTSIMVFELVTPRLLAPYIGTSHYIWTIVIGIVMTSLSIGYFLGGKLSEKKSSINTISTIYLIAGILAFIVYLVKDISIYSLMTINKKVIDIAWISSSFLIAPFTLTLGMIVPISIKHLSRVQNAGKVSGNVYAISTIGSLIGTFATGFWLIPSFTLSNIILSVSIVVLLCGVILLVTPAKKVIAVGLIMTIGALINNSKPNKIFKDYYEKYSNAELIADINTRYNRIWIHDHKYEEASIHRIMSDSQSALVINQPITSTMEDRLNYYSYFNLFAGSRKTNSILMIGGGAYTYANYLQFKYSNLKIDIVEIDPELLGIAEQYFDFKPGKNFTNYNMDGREFINYNEKKYDAIFLDAYQNGTAIPFQLVTQEAILKLNNSLNDDGELFVNTISSLTGSSKDLLLSEYKTIATIFKFVDVFPVFRSDPMYRQNYVIVGKKNNRKLNHASLGLNPPISNMEKYLENQKLLTDDYAPVEYYDLQSLL